MTTCAETVISFPNRPTYVVKGRCELWRQIGLRSLKTNFGLVKSVNCLPPTNRSSPPFVSAFLLLWAWVVLRWGRAAGKIKEREGSGNYFLAIHCLFINLFRRIILSSIGV